MEQRLKEHGNWLAYAQSFLVSIPLQPYTLSLVTYASVRTGLIREPRSSFPMCGPSTTRVYRSVLHW
jgi:hypothetical protein